MKELNSEGLVWGIRWLLWDALRVDLERLIVKYYKEYKLWQHQRNKSSCPYWYNCWELHNDDQNHSRNGYIACNA